LPEPLDNHVNALLVVFQVTFAEKGQQNHLDSHRIGYVDALPHPSLGARIAFIRDAVEDTHCQRGNFHFIFAGLFENLILQFFVEQRQATVPPAKIHLHPVQPDPFGDLERARVRGFSYRPVADPQLKAGGSFCLLALDRRSAGACHCKPGGRASCPHHHLAAGYV